MGSKERDQCSHNDKFWGLDDEKMHKEKNQQLMAKGFKLSLSMEMHYKDLQQQQNLKSHYIYVHDYIYRPLAKIRCGTVENP